MLEAGDFLCKPTIGFLSGYGVLGVALLCWWLRKLHKNVLRPLDRSITDELMLKSIRASALAGLVFVLVVQAIAIWYHSEIVEASNPPPEHVSGEDLTSGSASPLFPGYPRYPSPLRPPVSRSPGVSPLAPGYPIYPYYASKKTRQVWWIVQSCKIALFLIGAGYTHSVLPETFWMHLFWFLISVGLIEESAKALGALVLFHGLFTPLPSDASERAKNARILSAFAIAGLGFGSGEALYYFGGYYETNASFWWYVLRATWCVSLHGCWAAISGVVLLALNGPSMPGVLKAIPMPTRRDWLLLLVSCVPSIILHSLYDAACDNAPEWLWIIGISSAAMAVVSLNSVASFGLNPRRIPN